MASPHVAAAAALLRSVRPDLPAARIIALLNASTAPATGFGFVVPRLDVALALTLANQEANGGAPVVPEPGQPPVVAPTPAPATGDPDSLISAIGARRESGWSTALFWTTRSSGHYALGIRIAAGTSWRVQARTADG